MPSIICLVFVRIRWRQWYRAEAKFYSNKGILFDRDHDLDDTPEEEIKQELESLGVVNVKRFTKKRNDIIEPTNIWLPSSENHP
jgi:hypothetical protein